MSLRPSSAHSIRASHAGLPGSSSSSSSATSQRHFTEKKKELDALFALEASTAELIRRMEGMADDAEVMAFAGKVHGDVLSQWPQMFQILRLFLETRNQAIAESAPEVPRQGERLVRVPIEELQDVKNAKDN